MAGLVKLRRSAWQCHEGLERAVHVASALDMRGGKQTFAAPAKSHCQTHESGYSGLRFNALPCCTSHQGQQCAEAGLFKVCSVQCGSLQKHTQIAPCVYAIESPLAVLTATNACFFQYSCALRICPQRAPRADTDASHVSGPMLSGQYPGKAKDLWCQAEVSMTPAPCLDIKVQLFLRLEQVAHCDRVVPEEEHQPPVCPKG